MQPVVYIVIVNWNGWVDTIECLESVFKLRGQSFRVVVCDNGSSDGSLNEIERWASGARAVSVSSPEMAGFSGPPEEKPIRIQNLSREQVESGAFSEDAPLVLIDCGKNLGFAGGNNVGFQFVLAQEDMACAWLLNNDTVVDPGALKALWEKHQQEPEAGIIGSTLVYYQQPDKVQAFGGSRYFPCLGRAMHIGRFHGRLRKVDENKTKRRMDYVIGASMLVTREFLETVGLMSEDYFLYYEELDWALRARGSFTQSYASESRVFHKAGASIGSSNKSVSRSVISDWYLMQNRLKITRRFFPGCLFAVRAVMLAESFLRLLQGQGDRAKMIWHIVMGASRDAAPPGSLDERTK